MTSRPDAYASLLADAIRERDQAEACLRDADAAVEEVCRLRLDAAAARVRAIIVEAREAEACR